VVLVRAGNKTHSNSKVKRVVIFSSFIG
jgi:hypothetical protein